MADSQLLTVIRIWAAMAWADGVIAEAEASALRRLIANAKLEGEALAQAEGYLELWLVAYLNTWQVSSRFACTDSHHLCQQ